MERSPFAFDREPHYTVDAAAKRLRMSPRYLAECIQSGDLETRFNGRHVLISEQEVNRFRTQLQQEFEAAEAAEQEQTAQEAREKDGAHIARLMSEAQGIAAKYGYDPGQD